MLPRIVASLLLLLPVHLAAQETRGQILGRVHDQTGAVVPGAEVSARNQATNTVASTRTNATGDYVIPFLNPGTYTLTVEQAGFKKFVQEQIQVRVSDALAINPRLEVGTQAESIRVEAETPLLETATASLGQVIDRERMVMLPLKDGASIMLANLSPGVLNFTDSGWTRPYDDGTISAISVNGSRTANTDFTLDGASNVGRASVAYVPPVEAVQEFKINTAAFDATVGNATGGSVNLSLKSGTNQFHGSDYYFLQNPALNANKFFSNRNGQKKPDIRANRWGLHNTGPVYIPGLYNGKDRTFWMYAYEGIHGEDPRGTYTTTVPLPAQRGGDFSGLLALGSRYQIYDPMTTTPAPNGRFSRSPFPGNIVPSSRINPTAKAIMSYWPEPNIAGTADGTNNWSDPQMEWDHYYNHLFRIDHNVGNNHRLYFRGDVSNRLQQYLRRFNDAVGMDYWLRNKGFAVDHVWMATPALVINTRYSLSHNTRGSRSLMLGMDLGKLAFSPVYLDQLKRFDPRGIKFPYINVAGYGEMGGNYSLDNRADDNQELTVNATRILRNHTLRAGMNFRDYRENTGNFGQGSGTFTFGASWTNGPLDNTPSAPVGQSLASFMLGLPTGGGLDINGTSAQRSAIWAGYVQDDWKVTPRLTLNFGLRYETESPTTERYDRTVLDFDFDATSPIEAAARANYAASPIPEIPVDAFRVKGGMRFAGVNGLSRGLFKRDTNNFMPRFGFAYQPGARTVLRGGIGLFYQLIGIPRQQVRQTGFSKQTQFVASTDNGQTYIANLSNPFPDGIFDQPPGSSLGLMTEVGNTAVVFNPSLVSPYVTRWQFSVQREITRKTVVEVGYVGSKTVKLQANKQYNSTPQQYYSTSPVRDNDVINYISQQVNNPFYPLLPRTQMAGSRIARSQLVRPYPQFTSVTQDTNQGYSWYHSMQTRFERRFDAGLTANLSWTWSKLMEATGYLNGFDAMPYEVISDQDRTHRLTLSGIYELPFGPKKRFGGGASGLAGLLIGGWQVSYIYQAQSGALVGFGNVLFYGDSSQIVLPEGERTIARWFNTGGFERDTAKQLSWNVRTFPNRFSGLRADGMNNWDISLLKRTKLSERIASELRADFCNAMNHPQFSGPNTSPTSTAFGTITSEAQWPRTIQVSLKLVY